MLNTSSNFDLAVIGGGPAGTAAAITAARLGARVVLFEARDLPRHKVCGEFVSGEALELLAGLLQEVPAGRVLLDSAPPINRARLFLGKHSIEAPIFPAARSITRYDLDAQLWHAAQAAGVVARASCEVSAVTGDGPFQLTMPGSLFNAAAVIVAAGRWSQLTPDRILPPGPRWIGVKGHFREPHASRTTDLYFFQRGYCGVQPLASDVVNACAMVRSDCATTLEESFQLHPKLAERAAGWNAGDSARQHCSARLSRYSTGPRQHSLRRRCGRIHRSICRRRHLHRPAKRAAGVGMYLQVLGGQDLPQ